VQVERRAGPMEDEPLVHADGKSKGPWLKFGSYAAVAGIVKESDTAKLQTAGWSRLVSTDEATPRNV